MIHGEYSGTSNTKLLLHLNGNSVNSIGSVTSTETNLTYVPGKFDQCANFNQTNSSITYADIGTLATFTISLWINTTSISNCILCQSGQYVNGFFFQINDVGKIDFEIWNGGASTHIYSTVPINDGNWHNIIVTRSSATVNIYIDGNFNNQSTTMYTFTIENYYRSINKKLSGYSSFNGKLDEIIIENIVWPATKVQNYYNTISYSQTLGEFLPTTNTLNYFKFNGNSNNSIGNIDSTDTNITYVPGKYGQCANFNGTNSNIKYTGSELTNFTVSLWFKTVSTNGGYLISQSATNSNAFDLTIHNNGEISAVLWQDAYVGNKELLSNLKSLNNGQWHNVLVTRNGSTVIIYIDGKFDIKRTDMFTFTVGNYYKTIGSHNSGVNWYNGQIDEIIIENKVWTENEVRKYYANSLGRFAIL